MNILISNDDGILSNGIRALIEPLSEHNNVYVVAPDRERSASAHSLTLLSSLRVEELDSKYGAKRCWMTTGTPVDCIKLAVSAILSEEEKPDLVISGINHGPNLGSDILYSGTVSCAMEGAMLGLPGIAVSLGDFKSEYEDFKFAGEFVAQLVKRLDQYKIPPKTILNVNVPALDKKDIKGIKITEMGNRIITDNYEKQIDSDGKVYYQAAGRLTTEPDDTNTDVAAIKNNMISITPISYEMTKTDILQDLRLNIAGKISLTGSDCRQNL